MSLLQLTGMGVAGSNGFNNLPVYLALETTAGSPVRLAALLIGVNLGPLLSPCASLAGAALVAVLIPAAGLARWFTSGMPG